MSEVCPTENASLRLDKRFLAKSPAQLAVCLLWTFLRRSLSPMDVYCKTFPAQRCLPVVSITYIFGMLAAILFFHEQVSVWKWLGIGFIMIGCCLIAK